MCALSRNPGIISRPSALRSAFLGSQRGRKCLVVRDVALGPEVLTFDERQPERQPEPARLDPAQQHRQVQTGQQE
ncbi:hypothetical protein MELE44368_03965 [Mycolicibacterium elephantis DSM 44368]|uniref:Uncharacterized protein n=1 Tax=Mycolicibacterium elephantis DSM 44368 TaxID=1335622 RepID=A0A439DRG8_9MYCO|nr:hypothetical protein MELE44368_03965 [Mycolicibacterium elephantis DSM 44368]